MMVVAMAMVMMHGSGKYRSGKHHQKECGKNLLHGSNPSTKSAATPFAGELLYQPGNERTSVGRRLSP